MSEEALRLTSFAQGILHGLASHERAWRLADGARPGESNGGGRGIRTPGTVSRTAIFKTAAFNRSAIPPHQDYTRGYFAGTIFASSMMTAYA